MAKYNILKNSWKYIIAMMLFGLLACKVRYSFNDAKVNPNYKTINVVFFENKARYINPQVSQKLTDKLQQKIIGNTKLSRTQDPNADYVVNSTITTYDATQTVGVSAQQASVNRLTVSIHIVWHKNKETDKDAAVEEFDVSRSFDYPASYSLQQGETAVMDDLVRTLTDDIFNRMFSNW